MHYAVFKSAGEDTDNRYSSTVVVESPDASSFCSGVLVHPSLVLTAAHCVCPPKDERLFIDTASCSKSARVSTYVFEKKGTSYRRQSSTGAVVAHQEFKARLDAQRAVVESTSDLAVIFLKEAVQNIPLGFDLTDAELQIKSKITLVGYGLDTPGSGAKGRRLFGTNEVTGLALTDLADGDNGDVAFLFEKPGAHAAPGDSGGPCFRETPQGRWLVGVVSQSREDGQGSRMTSLYPHLLWLKEQIAKAEKHRQPEAP